VPYEPLEEKRVYANAQEIADQVWSVVDKWDWFAKSTVGKQLTCAADSIGANVAEAGGRIRPADVKNLLYFARGSTACSLASSYCPRKSTRASPTKSIGGRRVSVR
jgi:hypothetical protein